MTLSIPVYLQYNTVQLYAFVHIKEMKGGNLFLHLYVHRTRLISQMQGHIKRVIADLLDLRVSSWGLLQRNSH